ncbi:MAG: hypothetical protein V4557_15695 [Bacteroidota bacterium]
MKNIQPAWLNTPIGNTQLSDPFKQVAAINGYHTIGQLLAIRLTDFLNHKWFTLTMLEEVSFVVGILRQKKR